jgi:hypothetical protein
MTGWDEGLVLPFWNKCDFNKAIHSERSQNSYIFAYCQFNTMIIMLFRAHIHLTSAHGAKIKNGRFRVNKNYRKILLHILMVWRAEGLCWKYQICQVVHRRVKLVSGAYVKYSSTHFVISNIHLNTGLHLSSKTTPTGKHKSSMSVWHPETLNQSVTALSTHVDALIMELELIH